MWKNQDGEKFNRNVFSNNLAYSNGIWGNSYKNVYHKAINKPTSVGIGTTNSHGRVSFCDGFVLKNLNLN